jgi:hypothetical protein
MKLMAKVAAAKARIVKAERGIHAEPTRDLVAEHVAKVESPDYQERMKKANWDKSQDR